MIGHWRWVLLAVAVAWGVAIAYSTATARVLYGDGSWSVLQHLLTPLRFNDYDVQRSFASFITQAPILFGQRIGVDSVFAYAALYSFGIFVIPAVAMVIALSLARQQPALFAANGLAILIYGFGANFINSEANLLFGFVWLAVTILALEGPAPILRSVVLPTLAFAMLRLYEGMLLVGPVLALWAIMATARIEAARDRIGLVLAALLFFLGATIGLGGFLAPRSPGNASNFLLNAFAYLRNPHAFLLMSGLAVIPGICLSGRWLRLACVATSAMFGLGFVAAITRLEGFYSFSVYYQNRSFMMFSLSVFVAALLVVEWRRPGWMRPDPGNTGHALLLVPFAFAVTGDAVGTYRWSAYVQAYCEVLDQDVSPLERLNVLQRSGARTAWTWTHPTMSVLLRDRGSKAMVVNEPGAFQWEPFDPADAVSIGYWGLCQAPLVGPRRTNSNR